MQWTPMARDDVTLPGELKNRTVTPYFRFEQILNEPQSRLQEKAVFDTKEVVEIRFATNSQYKPVFGVDEVCDVDELTGRSITWAERYKTQYLAFQSGTEQVADGTPLEELQPYGISQAQLSLCRALNIYSIEALANLPSVKKLGQHANELVPMAKRYLDAKRGGAAESARIAELERLVAGMQAAQRAPNPFEQGRDSEPTDSAVKDEIERLTGVRPRGNPSRATLDTMLEQAKTALEAQDD